MPNNLKTYHFNLTVVCSPAYGRYYITREHAIDDFVRRQLDWKHEPSGRYMSIRDCAPGCIVELRFGKRLQKSITYTVCNPAK